MFQKSVESFDSALFCSYQDKSRFWSNSTCIIHRDILSSIDRKIELNKRINDNLGDALMKSGNSVSAYSNEPVEEKYRLEKGDLLIGMDGNFHINYWTDNVSFLNQRSVRLRTTLPFRQCKQNMI